LIALEKKRAWELIGMYDTDYLRNEGGHVQNVHLQSPQLTTGLNPADIQQRLILFDGGPNRQSTNRSAGILGCFLSGYEIVKPFDVGGAGAAAPANHVSPVPDPLAGATGVGFRIEIVSQGEQAVGSLASVKLPVFGNRLECVGVPANDPAGSGFGHKRDRFCDACGGRTVDQTAGDPEPVKGMDRLLDGFPASQPSGSILMQGPGDPHGLSRLQSPHGR
jgi:hypothetical protein